MMSRPADVVELRTAPHSIETEQALLGAILLDNAALARIRDLVCVEDFYRDDHRRIYAAICRIIDVGGGIADVVSVSDLLRNGEDAGKTGGLVYLSQIASNVPSISNARRYAEIVREKSGRRRLLAALEQASDAAHHGVFDDVLARLHEQAAAALPERAVQRNALDWPVLESRDVPDRDWAIPYWIGMGHATLLAGAGGVGKTLLAQQLGAEIALGRTPLGEPVQPRRVLLVACEDDHDELWRRQIAIARHLWVSLGAFAGNLIIEPRVGMHNVLAVSEYGRLEWTQNRQVLKQMIRDYKAEVVILDNVRQMFAGDENSGSHVTQFCNGLIGMSPRSAIVILAHPGRSLGSEFAGSGAWENAVRSRLYLGRSLPDAPVGQDDVDRDARDDGVRYLCRRKANYTGRDYVKFTFDDGVMKIVRDGASGSSDELSEIRRSRSRAVVVDGLRKLTEMRVDVSDARSSQAFLPRQLIAYQLAENITMRELGEAMRALMVAGRIARGVVGQYANRAPKYGLVLCDA
jgi:hypothetical protein